MRWLIAAVVVFALVTAGVVAVGRRPQHLPPQPYATWPEVSPDGTRLLFQRGEAPP